MTKLAVAFVLVLSLFAVSAAADEWTGWISDSKCGPKGANAKHQTCAEKCVKGGAAPVFVTGDKTLKIDDASRVQEHIGHQVTVTGTINGDTIKIETVKMAG